MKKALETAWIERRFLMVSIVMPAYNSGKTIRDSVNSIFAQTYPDWELIVIDDGSIDDTSVILEEFARSDDRVRFLQNAKNMGVSYTRNRAVTLAKGEWIAFLDSDDLWDPWKLEKQMALAENHSDMIVCYTASAFMDDKGNQYNYVMPAVERLTYKNLLRKNLMSCSSVMIKASVMKNIRMPNDKMHEDYFVWLTVLRESKVAYGINEPLLIYRLSTNSKSSKRFKSARMLFNSYKAVGYSFIASCVLTLQYTFHSVIKRYRIYKSVRCYK